MWSMRSSATEGFTLSEMLLALGTAMLCSVLLTWMVRFFVIGIHTQQQLVQDQIAVLQLRLLCASARRAVCSHCPALLLQPGDSACVLPAAAKCAASPCGGQWTLCMHFGMYCNPGPDLPDASAVYHQAGSA